MPKLASSPKYFGFKTKKLGEEGRGVKLGSPSANSSLVASLLVHARNHFVVTGPPKIP